jgi:eukaryotic-like serine/threonine-protein kinase
MSAASSCRECGSPLPAGAQRGVCPRCILRLAMTPALAAEPPGTDPPGMIHLVLSDGTTAPLPFRELGDYELIEEIGHGGMGIIFKARQRSLDRIVALKLIRAGSLARPGDIARFRTEAAAAARLQHHHIVAIHEVGEHQGQHFYSMEFVPGHSLSHELRRRTFAPLEAARLMQSVAEAIDFAHQRGILHRDLKPSNILLDLEREPRVADFGLAKILQSDSELTVSGAVLGSPHYMPPEQASGRSSEASVRSDVYSLGAIFYELLTGRPPFSAATPLETMKMVVEQEPVSPRALHPGVPADLETICLKCLAKEPGARYATARELADELGRFLRDEPIRARPAGPAERAWRWCRRKPALAALGLVIVLAPAVIISVLLITKARVTRERNRALAQEQITRMNLYAADIALADRALADQDYDTAWRALEAASPGHLAGGGESMAVDLRGFEWRWLWQRAQGEARKSFPAHLSIVKTIEYSPDGRFLASASSDATTKIWDARREEGLRTIWDPDDTPPLRSYSGQYNEIGRPGQMLSASFTADSRRLLTGSAHSLILWDLENGRPLWRRPGDPLGLGICSPTNPGLALVINNYPRTNAALVDLVDGRPLVWFANGRSDEACFAPDGLQFARWDRELHRIWLHTVPSGEITGSLDATGIYVIQMAFTPDGKTLAAGDLRTGAVKLFDVSGRQLVGELPGHGGRIWSLSISPDGRWLADGGYDQTIHLWDLATRREVRQLRGHRAVVNALAFSPDSQRLASGGYDGTVRFWDVFPPNPPSAITNAFGAFGFAPDGRQLVTQAKNGMARLWDLPGRQLVREWATPPFQSAVFASNGVVMLASCGFSNEPPTVRHWSSALAEETISLRNLASPCSIIALSADGKLAATGHQDGTVVLWSATSGRLIFKKERAFVKSAQGKDANAVAFSADSQSLAAASFDSACAMTWSVPDGLLFGRRAFGGIYPMVLAISPDGNLIATSGVGQGLSVNVWDRTLCQREMTLRHQDVPVAAAFSPDGRTLASSGADGQLKLWHLPTMREVATLLGPDLGVRFEYLAFSPDGAWLGGTDSKGILHLFHGPIPSDTDSASNP